jgi:hypothetical protein
MIPNQALCNAFRLLLKTSDPLHLDPSTFLHHMAACFKYATLLEHDRRKLDVALIEEIDHLAHQVISNTSADQGTFAQRISTTDYHWSSAISGGRANSTFLTFAVRFRLDSYVDFKLDNTDIHPVELSGMLHAAVVDFDNLLSFGPYALPNQGSMNLELVTRLLKKGASPYEYYHGISAYEAVLDEMCLYGGHLRKDGQSLLRLFERYGRRLDKADRGNTLTPEEVHLSWSFKDELVKTNRPGYAATICIRMNDMDVEEEMQRFGASETSDAVRPERRFLLKRRR